MNKAAQDPVATCRCGCGEPVKPGRNYVATHDSKHRAKAARITDQMTPAVRRQFFRDGYQRWIQK
jgi:hypothetical protein